MKKILDELVENLKMTFTEAKIKSVIFYGSCAVEDCSKSFNNLNIIVVLNNLTASDLKCAEKLSKTFGKKAHLLPLFMDYEEWKDSTDVYAIEYADIKDRYKILLGENIVDDINVENKDLRFLCEKETKNLLIRLRQTYLSNTENKKILHSLILNTAKNYMVIFRTILRLSGISVPKTYKEVVKLFAQEVSKTDIHFDADLFLKILEFKNNRHIIKKEEFEDVIQKLINTTNSVLNYVDKM